MRAAWQHKKPSYRVYYKQNFRLYTFFQQQVDKVNAQNLINKKNTKQPSSKTQLYILDHL